MKYFNNYQKHLKKYWNILIPIVLITAFSISDTQAIPPGDAGNEIKAPNQQVTITGTVTSEAGEALPGVNVVVQGSDEGTVTDVNGEYTIQAPEDGTLVFSFVGYQSKEIPVDGRSSIDVSMQQAVSELEEVVVVGYGEQDKATSTGAVSQIGEEAFDDLPISNPGTSLQGALPGLTITRDATRPGNENLNIQIRGATSVNGVDPLIVIDGVPTTEDQEFLQMNSDDIESISVLKDASASIYGARAAGGVILVTTKSGQEESQVNYSSNVRMRKPGRTDYIINQQEYGRIFYNAVQEDGTDDYWIWTEEMVRKWKNGEEGHFPDWHIRTPFHTVPGMESKHNMIFGTTYSHEHTMSASGGSENLTYRISGNYADNQANLETARDGERKYNLRAKFGVDLSDAVELNTNIRYTRAKVVNPHGLGKSLGVYDPPLFEKTTPEGNFYYGFSNIYAKTKVGGKNIDLNKSFRGNVELTAELTETLQLRGRASYTDRRSDDKTFYKTYKLYNWDETVGKTVNPEPSISRTSTNEQYQNYGGFLNYEETFGANHNVSAMIGGTAELEEAEGISAWRNQLLYDELTNISTGDPSNINNGGFANHWGLLSYVGRFNYDFQGKYLFEVSGRREGSSRFHPDHRWSNFGAFSAGWVITGENFMDNIDLINHLKLRGGYGEMGAQSGIGLYDYLSTVNTGTDIFGEPGSYSRYQTASLGGLTSRTRTWERVGTQNIGMDFRLLNNRLTGSFDYFIKKNDGMLIDINYPDVLGGNPPATNDGVLKVKGWEFQMGWQDKVGEFSYNASFNISDDRSKLIKMEGQDSYHAGVVGTREGDPLGAIYVYETDGLFESQEEVDAYYDRLADETQGEIPSEGSETQALRPGDIKKVDLDGNGYISALGAPEDDGDVKKIGDNRPHYSFGTNLGAQWKGFDLRAFFQGVLEHRLVTNSALSYPFFNIWTSQPNYFIGKTWTEDNKDAQYPRLTQNGTRAAWNYRHNDFHIRNARYIRLKNLTIGYTLPEQLTQRIGINKFRVYLSGNDLWEATPLVDGFDPEYPNRTATYPFARVYSIGVDVTF